MNRPTGRIFDITVPTSTRTVSWRDAFAVQTTWHAHTADGAATTNSSWWLHAHTGTHVDAPLHHLRAASSVDELELTDYLGPCRVLDLSEVQGDIAVDELRAFELRAGERLLLRTSNSRRRLLSRQRFTDDYTGLTEGAARYLADRGVRLVGTDFLGIEPPATPDGRTHRALLDAGIAILEGLALDAVPAGDYVLLFLPLKLVGAEAAPGRAVLVADSPDCTV